jgi:hypothetical protein
VAVSVVEEPAPALAASAVDWARLQFSDQTSPALATEPAPRQFAASALALISVESGHCSFGPVSPAATPSVLVGWNNIEEALTVWNLRLAILWAAESVRESASVTAALSSGCISFGRPQFGQ